MKALPQSVKSRLSEEYIQDAAAYIFKNTAGEATKNSLNALGQILSNPKYKKEDAQTLLTAAKYLAGNALYQQLVKINNEISGRAGEGNEFLENAQPNSSGQMSDSKVDETLKKFELLIQSGDFYEAHKNNPNLPMPTSEDIDIIIWGARFHTNADTRFQCASFLNRHLYLTPIFEKIEKELLESSSFRIEPLIPSIGKLGLN